MTERSLSISTQIATPIKPSFTTSGAEISTNDTRPVTESVDEEPYVIRCICDTSEDDGNTIYCDKCDTWQHIECYYPGSVEDASREDFVHKCVECNPRELDGRHATEKQQYRQNKANNDNNDKKNKRPATKSHKKKTKPSEIQTNGFADPEHHKKAKGHRSHHSVSSQVTKRSPPYSARNNHHPPSPIRTPPDLPIDFRIHTYSDNFLSLYDDEQFQETDTNTLANLTVTNKLSTWITDAKQFELDVGNGKLKFDDVVQKLEMRLDPHQFPKLHIDVKTAHINNTRVQWKTLVTTTKTPANQPIGEINGQIGLQCDYHQNPENRWEECVHPRPLTFFIPGLPLYIDTRDGGSQCRYVRRSCKANANLETYIVANTSEYHFYLTCDSNLPPNEQITLPWDFKFLDKSRLDRALHLDGDDDRVPDISESEYQSITNTISSVLSDHGGCACNAGKDCAFVKFHRDYYGRVHAQPPPPPPSNGANVTNGVKSKKGRKPKQHVSPTSTGHATNSRAASEGHPEVNDDDDTRSISGSVRSKPRSRDLTPMHGIGETNGILTEPTDREKRKLAMLEDSFRKMEQSQPARKKKRASDGSNMNSPITTTASQTNSKPRQKSVVSRTSVSQSALANPNGSRARQYVDASTSRRQSGSPLSAASPKAMASPKAISSRDDSATAQSRRNSITSKVVYADSSTQTDRDEDAWYEARTNTTPKRPILSLAKRMLRNRFKILAQVRGLETRRRTDAAAGMLDGDLHHFSSPTSAMDIDGSVQEDRSITESPTDTKTRNASIVSSTPSVDVLSNSGDYHSDGPTFGIGQTMKPPPWSGNSTNGHSHRSPELRVQMPPIPAFITPNLSGTPGTLTPSSAIPSSAISPYGTSHFPSYSSTLTNGVNPSPAKKKMSLNDYKARKKQNADGSGGRKASVGSSPTMPPAVLKPTLSTIDEVKVKKIVDPALDDAGRASPLKDDMPS
ncbi:hypothetical protein MFRU_013g01380 [Monilinia fructicola]|nr:hypothetical protein MFRU_013g01380 [Monilinia fructicola]